MPVPDGWIYNKDGMAENKASYVTYEGRTLVDTNVLLRDPKVRQAISRIAENIKDNSKVKFLKKKPA